MAPGRVVRDAVGRIGHQQPGDLSSQEVVHVRGIGGIAAEQAVPAQREEIAPHDVGGAGSDDRVLVGLPALGALAEEPCSQSNATRSSACVSSLPNDRDITPERRDLLAPSAGYAANLVTHHSPATTERAPDTHATRKIKQASI